MNQYRYDISQKKKARAGEIRLIFWIFVPSDTSIMNVDLF